MVSTVSPKASDTPTTPMPEGLEAAITAAPQPPRTSQNVPMNSAIILTRSVIAFSPREIKKAAFAAFFGLRKWRSNDVQVLDALVEVLVLRHLAVQLDVEAHFVGRVGEAQRVFVADAPGLEEV